MLSEWVRKHLPNEHVEELEKWFIEKEGIRGSIEPFIIPIEDDDTEWEDESEEEMNDTGSEIFEEEGEESNEEENEENIPPSPAPCPNKKQCQMPWY